MNEVLMIVCTIVAGVSAFLCGVFCAWYKHLKKK